MDGDAAGHILSMGGVALMNFSKKSQLGAGRRRAVEKAELDRRVEALFGLVGFLETYVMHEDTAARYRSAALKKDSAAKLVRIRDLISANREMVQLDQFNTAFGVAFNEDFLAWTRELAKEGAELQNGTQGGGDTVGGQRTAMPIPLPAFKNLWQLLDMAPLTQLTVAGADGG